MEKIMIFGIAAWFGIMMSISPRPVQKPPKPAPSVGPTDIELVTRNEPKPVIDNSKPVKIPVEAEFWHSPE